jgi:hypothetical protein
MVGTNLIVLNFYNFNMIYGIRKISSKLIENQKNVNETSGNKTPCLPFFFFYLSRTFAPTHLVVCLQDRYDMIAYEMCAAREKIKP